MSQVFPPPHSSEDSLVPAQKIRRGSGARGPRTGPGAVAVNLVVIGEVLIRPAFAPHRDHYAECEVASLGTLNRP